jgi:multiple sugar transport system permease protein
MNKSKGRHSKGSLLYVILIFYAIITLIPFLWAVSSSFKTLSEIVSGSMSFIPQKFTFENYKTIFTQEPLFSRWLFNSVLVSVTITAFNLLFNSMSGYALARIDFKGNKLWFFIVLTVLMVPGQITIIPLYLILSNWVG